MPISRYNKDGTVDIYNKKTGKVTTGVKPEDLVTYSPNLVAEYQAAQAPESQLARIKAEKEVEKLSSPGGVPQLSDEEQAKNLAAKQKAENVLNNLEQLYFGKEGGWDDMSKGRIGGLIPTIGRKLGANPTLDAYYGAKETAKPFLARAMGNTGSLSEKEQEAAVKLLPNAFATPEEARKAFATLRNLLQLNQSTVAPKEPATLGEKVGPVKEQAVNKLREILSTPFYSPEQKAQMESDLNNMNPQDPRYRLARLLSVAAAGSNQPQQINDKSILENAGNELMGFAKSVPQMIPAVAGEAASLSPLISLLTGGNNPVTGRPTGEMILDMPASMVNTSYKLGENPVAAVHNQPVTQALNSYGVAKAFQPLLNNINQPVQNVLFGGSNAGPSGPAGGGIKKGETIGEYQQRVESPDLKAYENAMNSGDMNTAVELGKKHAGDARYQIHTRLMGDKQIQSILDKAKKAGEQDLGPSQMSRNVYQSVLNISKKNKNMERLRPNETVGKMIEYKINGTPDHLMKVTDKVTGENGILSNVVNESITDIKATANMDDVAKVLNNIEEAKTSGAFPDLTDADFQALKTQINNTPSLSGPQNFGKWDLSRLLDLERNFQKKAAVNRADATNYKNIAAGQRANLYTDAAKDIGNIIDDYAKNAKVLDKYKNPAIVAELNDISPKLAKEFQAANSLSEVRRLQSPFVRMGQIIDLSMQEPSSLGRNLFRVGSQVPVVGPILDSVAQNAAVPIATKAAVALSDISELSKAMPVLKSLGIFR